MRTHGTEVYHYPGGAGKRLATCLQVQMVPELSTADWGAKNANFQVLRETDCPVVLGSFWYGWKNALPNLLTRRALTTHIAVVFCSG
ncbi:N-acetylmuramoyl-L-alanine amidase family protein [Sporomusa acidovorans]|uniref:N-acetylmuramoyl-L-alanine amidase family protein n=1 Tax=Sporomusa acidovorans TaxID=112900 RepID=UPI000B811ACB|nr:N-acetylmuramoyl-L-alanine amidase [Sporomusa acidovorans]